ncbi:MAG: DUF4860 domain-containing protein [Clostridia bacterium]|nr:DUF4860 domain-containing protein [Clostridia bacterium]
MYEKTRVYRHNHTISQAFVFLLMALFAVLSALMVLFGARLYRGIINKTEETASARVLQSYVANVVKSNDSIDTVRVENIGGTEALVFVWEDEDMSFKTMVYYHDNYIRELFVDSEMPFDPSDGEGICAAQDFRPGIRNNVVELNIRDAHGRESAVHIALRCNQEADHEET